MSLLRRWSAPPTPINLQWHTAHEIEFVRGLGHHTPNAIGDRLALLRSYAAGMAMRIHWGNINPFEVRQVVDNEIAAEVRRRVAAEIAENRAGLVQ